ncbi:MAG: phosphotransacetylase [Verrucomicrobiae bacterium]|jgi:phosphate acetyltransferase|nr:phosphotransacetylase [Verrucomicrobiae bacterium]
MRVAVKWPLGYLRRVRFIGGILQKLQRHPKRIVFPEGTEPRVLQAARQFYSLQLGAPILLGDRTRIKRMAENLNLSLEGVRIINPEDSDELERFAGIYEKLRKTKGIGPKEALEAVKQPNYFGAMMVAMHQADGLVSGTSEVAGSVLRPLFQVFRRAPGVSTASSCMIMEVEDTRFGHDGAILMGDCGVIPEPSVDQLADIAVSSAALARRLLACRPKVALLSFSTHGSARHSSVDRIQAAAAAAREKAKALYLEADFDGDLQVDAAIVPEVAERKYPDSPVAGRANVLVFPDLNSGNIGSKLVQHMARANAYGQIVLGLDQPAADVSRGANAHDILGVAAIVGLQAIAYRELYPEAGISSSLHL